MYYMLVACMVGPMNTGQNIITYLLLQLIPIVLHHLVHLILPEDPMLLCILAKTIAETSAWRLRGHHRDARPKRFKCFKKPKMKMVSTRKSSPLTSHRLCIPTEFRRIPAEFQQKAPAGTEFDRNSPEQAPECAIILT